MALVDILLPTYNRLPSLIMTLSGVAAQTLSDVHVIVADQSDEPAQHEPVVQALLRVVEARGGSYEWHHRLPSRGIAEQRDFLLNRATADSVLYLDDDVLMEPWVLDTAVRRPSGTGLWVRRRLSGRAVLPGRRTAAAADPGIVGGAGPSRGQWSRTRRSGSAGSCTGPPTCGMPASRCRPGRPPVQGGLDRLLHPLRSAKALGSGRFRVLVPPASLSFGRRGPGAEPADAFVGRLRHRAFRYLLSQVPSTVLNPRGAVDGHALALLPEMIERYVVGHGSPAVLPSAG